MDFAMTQEWKSSLLKPRLVGQNVFIQTLTPTQLSMIHQTQERGLAPTGFTVIGDTLVLRFDLKED